MDIESNKAVGASLRDVRIAANLTQADVAARLDKPQSYVSKIESGERALRLYELDDYARALGTTPEDLAARVFESER